MRTDTSIDDWLSEVRQLENAGELFRAYDLSLQGLEKFPGAPLLAHRAVLNLCNAGAIPQARRNAVPGVRLCVACQSAHDQDAGGTGSYNRRGSKDSQLR